MRRSLAILMVALALPGVSRAERRVVPLAEARVITSPASTGRVLLDFDSLQELGDVVVASAYLEIPLPDAVLQRDLELSVYPMARSWRGQNATWTTPWEEPGGDLDDSYFAEVTLHKGRRTGVVRLNVTQVVEEIVMEGASAHGFIVTTPLRRGDGFTEAQRALLGTMSGARLVVTTANGRVAKSRRAG